MAKRTQRLGQLRRILGYVVVGVLAAGWWTYLRPPAFGGPTSFVMVSGESMEPTYHTGDLVIVRKQSSYDIGDIVAFKMSSDADGRAPLVIHRVTDVRPDGRLVLQGDNNNYVDPWNPAPADVAGERFIELRGWGTVFAQLVGSPILLGAIFGGLITMLVMLGKPKDDEPSDEGPTGGVEPSSSPPDPVPEDERELVGALSARRIAVSLGIVALIAIVGSPTLGSASSLLVEGGVLQTFEPGLVEEPLPEEGSGGADVADEVIAPAEPPASEVELDPAEPGDDLEDESTAEPVAVLGGDLSPAPDHG